MDPMPMLREVPGKSLEGAIQFLNELKWSISVHEADGGFQVAGGHRLILETTSREAADALIYGLALAYAVLPKDILDQFRKYGEEITS